MEFVGGAVMAAGLARQEEIERLVDELFTYAHTDGTLGGMPPMFEVWGTKNA